MDQGSARSPKPDIIESEITFEDALARLEAVVTELEKGDLTLAESLEAFREGIKNLSICVGHLDAFEEQVEVLLSEYYASAPSWLGSQKSEARGRMSEKD
ncbi:MAG: exodeoxyribonuclease VII small subunit [Thermacetogeniaceae bacterium]|jgi:exodeoxyribonuclease VII small subunit